MMDKELSETCRVSFQKWISEISVCSWFYYTKFTLPCSFFSFIILFQLLNLSTVALIVVMIIRGPCLWPGYHTYNNDSHKMAGTRYLCDRKKFLWVRTPTLKALSIFGQHYFLSSSGAWWRVGLLTIPAVCTRSSCGFFTWYKNYSLLWGLKIRHCFHNSPNWSIPKPVKSSRHILTLYLGRRHFDNRRWHCGSTGKYALWFT